MTPDWIEQSRKQREWAATPLGSAFHKFENASARYWQMDRDERISDKRLHDLSEQMNAARQEFLTLLRGW